MNPASQIQAQVQPQVQLILQHLRAKGLSPEAMTKLAQAIIAVLQDPSQYPELIQMLMEAGIVQQGDVPEQFDPNFLTMVLTALKEGVEGADQGQQEPMQQQAPQQQFARGGLAQMAQRLANEGRGGDTMLAHINPREAEALRRMGGSGTINPNTGLREFKGGVLGDLGKGLEDLGKGIIGEDAARGVGDAWKQVAPVASVLLPMAVNFFAPGMGAAIGGMFGGGALGAMGSSAVMGGLGSALGGGDFAQGALMGGLGAGGGRMLGDAAGGIFGKTLSAGTSDLIGSALGGGALGALQGKGFLNGAVGGATGSMIGGALGSLGDPSGNALSRGIAGGGQTIGNAISAGYSPQQALAMGLVGGISKGLSPAQMAAGSKPAGYTVTGDAINDAAALHDMGYSNGQTDGLLGVGDAGSYIEGLGQGAVAGSGGLGFNEKTLNGALMLGGLLEAAQTPEDVGNQLKNAPGLSEAQKEYFNRAPTVWDWGRLQQDAAANGVGLGKYMSSNWNAITQGKYNKAGSGQKTAFATGGLNALRLASGSGSGRDDTIDAKLSDGEYVFDAETTAMLGDGSTQEGARRLDAMRENIRKHKGKALSRGKISPDAKSPLAYLKEHA
jgi:hypothetical protein